MIITDDIFKGEYRIKHDGMQYIVQRRRDTKKGIKWKSICFPSTLGGALRKIIIELIISEEEEMELLDYVRRVEALTTQLLNRLKY